MLVKLTTAWNITFISITTAESWKSCTSSSWRTTIAWSWWTQTDFQTTISIISSGWRCRKGLTSQVWNPQRFYTASSCCFRLRVNYLACFQRVFLDFFTHFCSNAYFFFIKLEAAQCDQYQLLIVISHKKCVYPKVIKLILLFYYRFWQPCALLLLCKL